MLLIGGTAGLLGQIDGANTVFVAIADLPSGAVVAINGLVRQPGDGTSNGYALQGRKLVLGEALVPGDTLTVHLPAPRPLGHGMNMGGPRPAGGSTTVLAPSGAAHRGLVPSGGAAQLLAPTLSQAQPSGVAIAGPAGSAQVP